MVSVFLVIVAVLEFSSWLEFPTGVTLYTSSFPVQIYHRNGVYSKVWGFSVGNGVLLVTVYKLPM